MEETEREANRNRQRTRETKRRTEKEREVWSLSLRMKTLIPSWGSMLITSSKPNYLPKASLPNTITVGIRTPIYEFEEWIINIQFIAVDEANLYLSKI